MLIKTFFYNGYFSFSQKQCQTKISHPLTTGLDGHKNTVHSEDLMWLPCSHPCLGRLISALVFLRALTLITVAPTGLQDLQQQSEAPDGITSKPNTLHPRKDPKKKHLRITIYTRILNWWLQQVITTLLCSEIQIFIFIAFKYIVLSQYSTSRVFTVNSESIKAPH